MVRAGILAVAVASIVLAGFGLLGVVLSISPLVWVTLASAILLSVAGLVFWGVNGGSHPMD